MKILLLVPDFYSHLPSHVISHLTGADNNLYVKTFEYQFDANAYDVVYFFPGQMYGDITNKRIEEKIGPCYFEIARRCNTILLIHNHYSCTYHHLTLPNRVVSEVLFSKPYHMLMLLYKYPLLTKSEIDIDNYATFILVDHGAIMCLVTAVEIPDVEKQLMPLVPLSHDISSNFEITDFFNDTYLDLGNLKEISSRFWEMQFYHVWESFYHKNN